MSREINKFENVFNSLASNALMDAAECFEDHQTCTFDKFFEVTINEEIIDDDILTLVELHSSTLEVEVNVQVLQELGDGILVSVRLLLDDLHQVFQCIATTTIYNDCD